MASAKPASKQKLEISTEAFLTEPILDAKHEFLDKYVELEKVDNTDQNK